MMARLARPTEVDSAPYQALCTKAALVRAGVPFARSKAGITVERDRAPALRPIRFRKRPDLSTFEPDYRVHRAKFVQPTMIPNPVWRSAKSTACLSTLRTEGSSNSQEAPS